MNQNGNYHSLKAVNSQIKFLTKSEIRLKILDCLKEKPMTIKEIVKESKLTYSSISSNVSKLDKNDYIFKKGKKYHIYPICEVYLKNILDFNLLLKLINNFERFWDKHEINEISANSLREITELNESILIESTPTDIYKPHNYMKNMISNSNEIKAIFPYLHPDYPRMLENLLDNNSKIEIIIPKDIKNHLFSGMNQKIIKKGLKNKNLKIKTINSNINISLTINKENMSLGLFKIDGTYDQNRLLTSKNPKAVKWALNLFNNINNKLTII